VATSNVSEQMAVILCEHKNYFGGVLPLSLSIKVFYSWYFDELCSHTISEQLHFYSLILALPQ
jgi:hypothetical protein